MTQGPVNIRLLKLFREDVRSNIVCMIYRTTVHDFNEFSLCSHMMCRCLFITAIYRHIFMTVLLKEFLWYCIMYDIYEYFMSQF